MSEIGGYLQLELPVGKEFYQPTVRLNSGRNALEYILIAKKYRKIYLPYYTCDVLLEPLHKHRITFEFYEVDANLEPVFDYQQIGINDTFLYTNYFGLKNNFIKTLAPKVKNLIVDNAQAFYSKPLKGIDTFYSPRKFFGIPDGAYLFSNVLLDESFDQDTSSHQRFEHLLKRIDLSARDAYADFTRNDNSLINQPIRLMSPLTQRLLESINYEDVAKIRIENFNKLHESLCNLNKLKLNRLKKHDVPLVYPFWSNDIILRDRLLEKKIYTARYWPNVKEWCKENKLEYALANEVIHLPIDQRYGEIEMNIIIKTILNG